MFPEHIEQIEAEAIAAYPNEAVWLITRNECRLVPNKSETPTEDFEVDYRTLAAAQRRGLLAVVHSHPDRLACPSAADMRAQIASAVPWGIVATDGVGCSALSWFGDQVPIPELEGRTFCHGITDCYSLIRDYYRLERGIRLPEFPRSWQWWTKGLDLYSDGFGDAGFYRLDVEPEHIREGDVQEGDVWLAQIRSPVPNHGGIYLGNELALHHVTSAYAIDKTRVSGKEPIHRWMPHITHWLRYGGDK